MKCTKTAGHAYTYVRGQIVLVASCPDCANLLKLAWQADLFEGECEGCECVLSGFPIKR